MDAYIFSGYCHQASTFHKGPLVKVTCPTFSSQKYIPTYNRGGQIDQKFCFTLRKLIWNLETCVMFKCWAEH